MAIIYGYSALKIVEAMGIFMENENKLDAQASSINFQNVSLDENLATILGNASNAAYLDFTKQPFLQTLVSGNERYDYHDRFYGLDNAPWGTGAKEKFGLIYKKHNDPTTVLFAFRGTASILDAFKDIESIGVTPFVPHSPQPSFPTNVDVGNGFFDIYSGSNAMLPDSMQSQLFKQLSVLKPKHIITTGHSLGCPLASLFTLDVAVCQPTHSPVQLTNINFASPRVGKDAWSVAYDRYVSNGAKSGMPENVTIRIVNYPDAVPMLPPSSLSFKHVGKQFLVAFDIFKVPRWWDKYNYVDYVLSWHSLNNYQTVVNHAVVNTPQTWGGKFQDAPLKKWEMVSHDLSKHQSTPKSDFLHGEMMKQQTEND